MTYRDRFREPIALTLKACTDNRADGRITAAALLETWRAFRLGAIRGEAGYAYSIFRDEVKRQLGLKRKLPGRRRKIPARKLRSMNAAEIREWYAKRQLPLFEVPANVVQINRRRKA